MPALTGLLCDLLARPELTVIATPQPTFGWILPEEAQTACQVIVGRDAARLARGEGDTWDSGRLARTEPINLAYGGPPLVPGGTYAWRVRVWADGAKPGPWSEPQTFTLASNPYPSAVSRYPVMPHRFAGTVLHSPAPGRWFADFGRHAFGWLELSLESADGETVEIRLGEKNVGNTVDLHPGGTIRAASVQLPLQRGRHRYRIETPVDQRNTTGAAVLLPPEFGVVLPFRYVEIIGYTGKPAAADLVQVRLEYPFDETASAFRSSDPALDAVWGFCKYSIRATTFCGVYVDGDRERIPYEADAYINQLGHYAVDREFSLARHSHEYLLAHPTWPTEWKSHSVMMAWADYEATGDTRSLARSYDILRRDKIYPDRARPDGLVDTSDLRDLVDWPPGERDDYDFRPVNTVVNAFHCHTLQLMARIATALGRAAEATDFASTATRARDSFHRVLFNPATGRYRDGENSTHESFHASVFALAFGLVPPEAKSAVVSFLKSRGIACSVYVAQYLLEALFEAGEAEYAISLMTAQTERSWHNMLQQGATITWEAWDNRYKPNQDWNHAWGAAPANIIPRYVLGVRPLEPGYGRVLIAPQPGPLREVHGTVPTIRGPIRVDAVRNANNRWQIDYAVPPGVTVELLQPESQP
jgi:alpha-L-rhamnosidase